VNPELQKAVHTNLLLALRRAAVGGSRSGSGSGASLEPAAAEPLPGVRWVQAVQLLGGVLRAPHFNMAFSNEGSAQLRELTGQALARVTAATPTVTCEWHRGGAAATALLVVLSFRAQQGAIHIMAQRCLTTYAARVLALRQLPAGLQLLRRLLCSSVGDTPAAAAGAAGAAAAAAEGAAEAPPASLLVRAVLGAGGVLANARGMAEEAGNLAMRVTSVEAYCDHREGPGLVEVAALAEASLRALADVPTLAAALRRLPLLPENLELMRHAAPGLQMTDLLAGIEETALCLSRDISKFASWRKLAARREAASASGRSRHLRLAAAWVAGSARELDACLGLAGSACKLAQALAASPELRRQLAEVCRCTADHWMTHSIQILVGATLELFLLAPPEVSGPRLR
jgi:hypothetical protein